MSDMKDKFEDVKDNVEEKADNAKIKLDKTVDDVKEYAHEAGEDVKQTGEAGTFFLHTGAGALVTDWPDDAVGVDGRPPAL